MHTDSIFCNYCGDKPARLPSKYCGGYCHHRDTVVVPNKIARLHNILNDPKKLEVFKQLTGQVKQQNLNKS